MDEDGVGRIHMSTGRKKSSRSFLNVKAHAEGLSSVVYSVDGASIVTGGSDGKLKYFSVVEEGGRLSIRDTPTASQDQDGAITALAITPAGDKVATASEDHVVRLYTFPGKKSVYLVRDFTMKRTCRPGATEEHARIFHPPLSSPIS